MPAARPLAVPALAALHAALVALALTALMAVPVRAQMAAPDHLALGGYDPVAYFTEGRAVPGERGIAVKWRGRMWRFSSAANRNAFEANPHAFLPQFGGACVVALSEGRIEAGVPTEFLLHGGRLYLLGSASRRLELAESLVARLDQAAAHWPELRKTVAQR